MERKLAKTHTMSAKLQADASSGMVGLKDVHKVKAKH